LILYVSSPPSSTLLSHSPRLERTSARPCDVGASHGRQLCLCLHRPGTSSSIANLVLSHWPALRTARSEMTVAGVLPTHFRTSPRKNIVRATSSCPQWRHRLPANATTSGNDPHHVKWRNTASAAAQGHDHVNSDTLYRGDCKRHIYAKSGSYNTGIIAAMPVYGSVAVEHRCSTYLIALVS